MKIQYTASIVNQMLEWKLQNDLSNQNKIQNLGTKLGLGTEHLLN
jgi:hypothetical protein